jgi:hypothetical protein
MRETEARRVLRRVRSFVVYRDSLTARRLLARGSWWVAALAVFFALADTTGATSVTVTPRSACAPPSSPPTTSSGAPDKSLLAVLGVLRRPATPADALPPQLQGLLGDSQKIFANYVRRARVASARTYYVIPLRSAACGSSKPHDGVILVCELQADGRIVDAGAGGSATASQIDEDGMFLVGGSCLHKTNATLIAGVVPDRVASITLHYPASTLTITPVGNVVEASIPDPGGPLWHPLSTTWRSSNGTIIKTTSGSL